MGAVAEAVCEEDWATASRPSAVWSTASSVVMRAFDVMTAAATESREAPSQGRQLVVREWAVRGTTPSAHVAHASDLLCAAMVMDSLMGGWMDI